MSYEYKGFEIFDLNPILEKNFVTYFESAKDLYRFTVTKDIAHYIRETQLKLCGKASEIKDYIFSDKVCFVDSSGEPCYPTKSGNIEITLSSLRLVKKGQDFYPKFEIRKVCVL
jgi:hypothetical protein